METRVDGVERPALRRREPPARGSVAAETRTHTGSYNLAGVRFQTVRRVGESEHTKRPTGPAWQAGFGETPENEMQHAQVAEAMRLRELLHNARDPGSIPTTGSVLIFLHLRWLSG